MSVLQGDKDSDKLSGGLHNVVVVEDVLVSSRLFFAGKNIEQFYKEMDRTVSIFWVYTVIFGILPNKTNASYGLVSTHYGCPYMEETDWHVGMMEVQFHDEAVTWSTEGHLIGQVEKGSLQLHGCFSDSNQAFTVDAWEPGNYCLLHASKACPKSMNLKEVPLSALGNMTLTQATGIYKGLEKPIQLSLCCSNQHGNHQKTKPLTLPFRTPFYLIKSDSRLPCADVSGYVHSEEFINITSNEANVSIDLCFYRKQNQSKVRHSSHCPDGWLYNGGYCYFFSNYSLPWFDGQAVCESMQGNMVSITNEQEQEFLAHEMDARRTQTLEFYIGFSDVHRENIWTWVDKVPTEDKFVNWNPNEPNDALKKEDCTFYRIDTRNWNDIDCQQDVAFICKRVAAPDPIQVPYLGRVTSSSTAKDSSPLFATDDTTDSCFSSRWGPGQWIQIDLGRLFDVYALMIIILKHPLLAGKVYVGLTSDDFLHNSALLCTDDVTTHHVTSLVLCINLVRGRYITVIQGPSDHLPNNIQICDVRVYAQASSCGVPLGVSTGEVSSLQLSASSSQPPHWAHMGRLNSAAPWCPSPDDNQPYFQVVLSKISKIQSIEISSSGGSGWIETFSLYTGMNEGSIEPLRATLDQIKVFHNSGQPSSIHPLPDEVMAKVIRLKVETYRGQCCLRLELYGCSLEENTDSQVCPKALGSPAVPLPRTSSGQLFVLFSFPCPGYIHSIEYFATSTDPFTIHTWVVDNNIMIGPVDMLTVYPSDSGMHSQVLNDSIPVQKGYLLGIHSAGKLPVPYGLQDDIGVLSSDMKHTISFTDVTLAPGSKLNLNIHNEDHLMVFSLSVILTKDDEMYDVSCEKDISSHSQLASPNFPGYYGQNRHCIWNIVSQTNAFVFLNFTKFDIEDADASGCKDTLSLYTVQEGTSQLLYTGSGNQFPLVMLDSTHILLEFISCFRNRPQAVTGFTAVVDFKECAGCGVGSDESALFCNQPCGHLATPNYPHLYPPNTHRSWHITVEEGKYIRLELGTLQVESIRPECNQDYLQLFDFDFYNNRKYIDKYCNAHPPSLSLFSSWHQMALEFSSDQEFAGTGFLAFYSSVQFTIPDELHKQIKFNDTDCPSSWVTYGTSCYQLSVLAQGTSWLDAENQCRQDQANLVSIMDKQEMLVLHYLLTVEWSAKETSTYIGLTDNKHEGQFRWSDLRPMIFTSWANQFSADTPQPDGGELEDCAVIQLANLYSVNQWHDVPCALNDVKQFICKKQLPAKVQPMDVRLSLSNDTLHVTSLYQCDTGEFIMETYLCDGFPDCRDGSDEHECVVCEDYQFNCGDGQCVHISKYCDFHQDCKTGADESHCVMPQCKNGEFQCENQQCIAIRGRCNLIVDCADGSDEQYCDLCQRPDTFRCYDGRCLPWHARCDGVKDCSGCTNEDEQGCFNSPFSLCDENIKCDWRPLEGFGILTLTHDLTTARWNSADQSSAVSVSYLGLSTDDELLAVMDKSYRCEQRIHFHCQSSLNTTTWLSLTSGILWNPFHFIPSCSFANGESCIVEINDKRALPVKSVSTQEGCTNGDQPPLTLGPLLCHTEVGANDVNRVMKCDNGQRTDTRWRCLFEFDQFGVQKGCRDMSHIQGCGKLQTQYTECKKTELAPDYVGTHSVTVSNVTCQRWDMQTPHKHAYSEPRHHGVDSVSDVHNFCRNPDKGLPPFCFTLDPEIRYEPCDIPICANDTGETWVFECPENYVHCPGDYCIPLHYVCDGQWHCPNGEDEQQCDSYHCTDRFACTRSQTCLPLDKVCDGVTDCALGDDEDICDVYCPQECECSSLIFNCSMANTNHIPQDINENVHILDLSYNGIPKFGDEPLYFPYLAKLKLNNNKIVQIMPYQFSHMKNLMLLDLSNNDLQVLPDKAFHNLVNLQNLILEGNSRLEAIIPGAFESLGSLSVLYVQNKSLSFIEDDSFAGLSSLTELDLSGNQIYHISEYGFQGLLSLKYLVLTGNDIKLVSRQSFKSLPNLFSLKSDAFKLCCLAAQVPKDRCLPPQDPISTCEDLMSTSVLRSFLWLLGLMALIGNIFVVLWRLYFPSNNVSEVIINNLAVSDLLMGLYMLIIAVVDHYYKGVFIEYSDLWRSSWLCKLAGFMATFSSEGSVLFLCLLTIDRFINIMFPFSSSKLNRKKARLAAMGVWFLAFVMSALPLLSLEYFGDSFYGRSGVCLALPITNETPPGWEYSTAVFIGFNLLGFVVITVGYSVMYMAIKRSGAHAAGGLQLRQQITLAKNMMIIVATDLVCWLPIICMGFAALTGAPINGQVYAWVIVFVLPVNSAINPILYTFSSPDIRKKLSRLTSKPQPDYISDVSQASSVGQLCWNTPLAFMLADKHDGQSLRSFCSVPTTSVRQIVQMLVQLVGLLNALHNSGFIHGQLNIKAVRICITKDGPKVLANGASLEHVSDSSLDFSDDIYHLGTLVKQVLQSLQTRENVIAFQSHV